MTGHSLYAWSILSNLRAALDVYVTYSVGEITGYVLDPYGQSYNMLIVFTPLYEYQQVTTGLNIIQMLGCDRIFGYRRRMGYWKKRKLAEYGHWKRRSEGLVMVVTRINRRKVFTRCRGRRGMSARLRLNAPWLENCVHQDCDIWHSE